MNFKEFIQMISIYVVSLIVRYIYFPVMRCYWKFFDDDSDSEYGPFVEYDSDDFIMPSKEPFKEPSKETSEKSFKDNLWIIEKDDGFECSKRTVNNGSSTSTKD